MADHDNDTTEEIRQEWLQAADAGTVDDLQRLLAEHPTLLNCRDRHQSLKASTALHVCAWRNHAHAAEFLLNSGADIEATDEAGMTPLQIDILRVCMEKMRPIPLLRARCIDAGSPVALAKYRRKLVRDRSSYDQINTSTLEVFLKFHADVDRATTVEESALLLAMDDGLVKHVKLLLSHGANAFFRDRHGRMALEVAAEHGYADLVEFLMKTYPELVAAAGERALRAAIHHDSEAVMQLLYGAVVNQRGNSGDPIARQQLEASLLHTAVEYDAHHATTFLLDRDVPVDVENDDGETPLHVACKGFECEPLLSLLLARNADGNRLSLRTGFSPFHIAVQHHSTGAIGILARHGADINLFDRNRRTPLVFAALNGYGMDTMETLISHGASFRLPSTRARDEVAPTLTSWVFNLAPNDVPLLVDRLLVAGCAEQERPRCVISSLLWSKHTHDALLFLFLALFTSSSAARDLAHTMILEWLDQNQANAVVKKLLYDALHR